MSSTAATNKAAAAGAASKPVTQGNTWEDNVVRRGPTESVPAAPVATAQEQKYYSQFTQMKNRKDKNRKATRKSRKATRKSRKASRKSNSLKNTRRS